MIIVIVVLSDAPGQKKKVNRVHRLFVDVDSNSYARILLLLSPSELLSNAVISSAHPSYKHAVVVSMSHCAPNGKKESEKRLNSVAHK